MPKRGEKLTFQMVCKGGENDHKNGWKSSFRTMDSAMERARFAIQSRRIRAPYSTVLVQDTSTEPPRELMVWAGLDDQLEDLINILPEVSEQGYDRRFFGSPEEDE